MTHFSRARRAALLVLPLGLLGACGVFNKAPAPAPVQVVLERPGKAQLEVNDAQNGARVVLDTTQTLVVRLALAGNQNPDWSLAEAPPGVFGISGPRFERASRDMNDGQADGETVWRLQPGKTGEFGLRFELRWPHSTRPPLRVVSYTVVVR